MFARGKAGIDCTATISGSLLKCISVSFTDAIKSQTLLNFTL